MWTMPLRQKFMQLYLGGPLNGFIRVSKITPSASLITATSTNLSLGGCNPVVSVLRNKVSYVADAHSKIEVLSKLAQFTKHGFSKSN
jgi:hypothetical protein